MNKFEIVDLYLEGFAKIYTGMHVDRLYLNFKQMPHPIYLFVGNSGSGKSSILKSIHPFAFNNGTGDESSNSSLIIPKRSGRKIIRYNINGVIITCKHLYIRKSDDSIQVKSFISENDIEMNPSGLVTTFKELVTDYFRIDESYLSLLALGNSVQSMVEYTSGERKKFAVRIFNELNVFMTYYKNTCTVVRKLDNILSNVVDKLGRYGNYDKLTIQRDIKDTHKSVQTTESVLGKILQEQGAIKANIERDSEAYSQYSSCNDSVTELLATVDRLKLKRKTSSDVAVLENQRNQIMKNIIGLELRIESLESSIKSELEFKELKLSTKSSLEDSITKIETGTNRTELEKLLANLDAELVSLEEYEIKDGIDYTKKKDDLITASIYLDELRGICADLVSEVTHQELIPDIFKKFSKNHEQSEREVDITYRAALERVTNLQNAHQLSGEIRIPNISSDCKKECPYKRFYLDSVAILKGKADKAKSILKNEQDQLNIAESKRLIVSILKKVFRYIKNHESSLSIVPLEIFNPETFVLTFLEGMDRMVYNMDLMSSTISILEQTARKSQLLTLKKTTEQQLAGIETTINLFDSMKVDLEKTILAIEKTDETLAGYQKDLEYNREQLTLQNTTAKELDAEIALAKELEECRAKIAETQKRLKEMDDCRERYEKCSKQLEENKRAESELRLQLGTDRNKLHQLEETLKTIESLESEKEILSSKYSEAILIRDAVSPSKGIPVEFIDDVIRNQMIDSINELIHVAYPDITLLKGEKDLIINDKEFTIPYKKNGVKIGDISEASDGERAMMSLAFSLVLIRLVSKVYNIMLLDEMDTALDKYGRTKYIDIIEQYMKTINASQIFLISHNSMFDMYNVNALQTTNVVSDYENKFVVDVYRENYTPEFIQEE